MDPWADSAPSWSPTEEIRSTSPPQTTTASGSSPSAYREGPVDPWAESSSSSTFPVVSSHCDEATSTSSDIPSQVTPSSAGDFDPWSGNTAPIAPLSSVYPRRDSEEKEEKAVEDEERDEDTGGWSRSAVAPSTRPAYQSNDSSSAPRVAEDNDEPAPIPNEDDPWGSGAVARRVKAQQEAEAAAQRMTILQLQEEAKGKVFDQDGNVVEVEKKEEGEKAEDSKADANQSAPAATGWRSLFSRGGAAKTAATETGVNDGKEVAKINTDVTRKSEDLKESPRSTSAAIAPKLWQAPSILGGHNRTTSSTSRSSIAAKEAGSAQTSSMSQGPPQGPGWEVTTKKPQPAGGGLIQSLFGSSAARSSGETERATTTSSNSREERKTVFDRFGRGLAPPPVVSAADEEDESYETSETGIEWESGGAFDDNINQSKQADLLSDDVEPKQSESAVGRLLGRWRGDTTNVQQKTKPEAISGDDLSWLEGVGASGRGTAGSSGTDAPGTSDHDWLSFMNQQPATKEATLIASRQQTGLARSASDRLRISSTAKGTTTSNVKAPPFAPPPAIGTSSASASGQRKGASPFSFRGPGQGMPKNTSNSRLVSSSSTQTATSSDAFGGFEQYSTNFTSPNPDDAYRDDVMDNNASLLKSDARPEQAHRTSSFLRGLQGRPRKSRYDYNDDEEDEINQSQDDSWSAFRDDPSRTSYDSQPYRDTHRKQPSYSSKPVPSPPTTTNFSEQGGQTSISSLGTSASRTSSPGSATSSFPLPPPAPSSRPQSMSTARNGTIPPPAPSVTPSIKGNQVVQQPSKPKTLSQGNTLTNDDLSFFESM